MFYTMKLVVLFLVASLMLVGAMVAIAAPNPAEAAPKHVWCYTAASVVCTSGGENFANKKECKDALAEFQAANPGIATQPCQKNNLLS